MSSRRPEAKALFWSWTISVSVGEFLGFSAPALAGVLTRTGEGSLTLIALVLGGSVEGAVLGWSQARVLRRHLPMLSSRRWILLTSAGAAFAWLVGMIPSTFYRVWETWPTGRVVLVAGVLGVVLLCSVGIAQWWELRRHLPRAARWIFITAGAWCVGLMAFSVIAPPLWHEGQSTAVIVAIGLTAGAAMAVTMAAITGLALAKLLNAQADEELLRSSP